jgi:cytochrome c-type biogenesis protein CcmH
MIKFIVFVTACWLLPAAHNLSQAGVEVRQFDTPQQEQRYQRLITDLRCLVCQNQNLADSNSQLAHDLRDRVQNMIKEGKSDQQVIDYMVARYGKFVLYKPPLDAVTAILWFGPLLLLLVLIAYLLGYIKKLNQSPPVELSDQERERSRQLLEQENHD